jgi:hypothetical protein
MEKFAHMQIRPLQLFSGKHGKYNPADVTPVCCHHVAVLHPTLLYKTLSDVGKENANVHHFLKIIHT